MIRNVFSKLLLLLSLLNTLLPAKAARLVYFGTSQSEGIYTAEFDSKKGSLAPISLAAEIASPSFLATHPNKQYLYSTTTGFEKPNTGAVAAFRIHEDGSLSLLLLIARTCIVHDRSKRYINIKQLETDSPAAKVP